MRPFILLAVLPLGACGPDLDALRTVCRKEAKIEVHDPIGWSEYLRALKRGHTKDAYGGNDPGPYLRPGYAEGFREINEFYLGKKIGVGSPVRNNFFLSRGDQPIATVTNYTLRWAGFGSGQSADCIVDYPEVYGLKAQ